MTIAVLRKLLRIPPPRRSRQQALDAARRYCAERQWAWLEPVRISEGLREYHIMTHADHHGGNAWLRVDIHSGEITYSFFARR